MLELRGDKNKIKWSLAVEYCQYVTQDKGLDISETFAN